MCLCCMPKGDLCYMHKDVSNGMCLCCVPKGDLMLFVPFPFSIVRNNNMGRMMCDLFLYYAFTKIIILLCLQTLFTVTALAETADLTLCCA